MKKFCLLRYYVYGYGLGLLVLAEWLGHTGHPIFSLVFGVAAVVTLGSILREELR